MIFRVLFLTLACISLALADPPLSGTTLQIEQNGQVYRYVLVPATQPQPEPKVLLSGPTPLTLFSSSEQIQSLTANNRTLQGYVVAATFDELGDHAVTLDGQPGVVRVTPAKRRVIQVAPGAKFLPSVGDLTELQLPRGSVFEVRDTLRVDGLMSMISAYGDPKLPKPVLKYVGDDTKAIMIEIGGKSANIVVQDITFDSIQTKHQDKTGTPTAIRISGRNIVVRGCEFLNIQIGVQTETEPQRVLVQHCSAPLKTGLRAYFAWVKGSDHVYLDNFVANSTREHGIRVGGCDRVTIDGNDISNLDRRPEGDALDYQKSPINVQFGSHAVVANNRLFGPCTIGPLGQKDGLKNIGGRFSDALITHNTIIGRQEIRHGASRIKFVDNQIISGDGDYAIMLEGYNDTYKRGTSDIVIENNTVTTQGKLNSFIRAYSHVDGCIVRGNTYIAPNLEVGTFQSAVVWLEIGTLADWTFQNNHWPLAKTNKRADGGLMYLGATGGKQDGYFTPAIWAQQPQVKGDSFDQQLPATAPADQGDK